MTRAIDLELGDIIVTTDGSSLVTGLAISDEAVGVLVSDNGRLQYKHYCYDTRFRRIGNDRHSREVQIVQKKLAKGRKA